MTLLLNIIIWSSGKGLTFIINRKRQYGYKLAIKLQGGVVEDVEETYIGATSWRTVFSTLSAH